MVDIQIDEDYIASLYARTGQVRCGHRVLNPTDKQEKILRDLWGRGTVRKDELAKALGVSIGTMRRWTEELKIG